MGNPTAKRSQLARILEHTAERMAADFKHGREAFDHNGVVGQEGEKFVAKFLREHLPASVGVTTGQILDVDGVRSKQIDVIVYDAMRTPMLFTGPESDTHLVPAEGVLAVVEVKTRLRKSDLESCLANCRSVKQRVRRAYFPQPIQMTHHMYGQEWVDLPIYFSVFGASSDNVYAGPLNELQVDVPVHERIDSVCYLDRGVSLNAGIDLSGGVRAVRQKISARSLPKGGLADVTNAKPLMAWFAMLASTVMQAGVRPIDVTQYLAGDLQVEAKIPAGTISTAMYEEVLSALAADQGLDADLMRRWQAKEPLSPRDFYEILRAPGYTFAEGLSEPERQVAELAREAAQKLPFEGWEKLGLVTFN